jgi:hypothetical protein
LPRKKKKEEKKGVVAVTEGKNARLSGGSKGKGKEDQEKWTKEGESEEKKTVEDLGFSGSSSQRANKSATAPPFLDAGRDIMTDDVFRPRFALVSDAMLMPADLDHVQLKARIYAQLGVHVASIDEASAHSSDRGLEDQDRDGAEAVAWARGKYLVGFWDVRDAQVAVNSARARGSTVRLQDMRPRGVTIVVGDGDQSGGGGGGRRFKVSPGCGHDHFCRRVGRRDHEKERRAGGRAVPDF